MVLLIPESLLPYLCYQELPSSPWGTACNPSPAAPPKAAGAVWHREPEAGTGPWLRHPSVRRSLQLCSAPPGSSLGRVNSSTLSASTARISANLRHRNTCVKHVCARQSTAPAVVADVKVIQSHTIYDLCLLASEPAGRVCLGIKRGKDEDALWEGLLTWQRRK